MAKDKPAKYWRFKLDTRRKFTELSQEIARINSGGGADIDLTDYATKVWVEAQGYITASALTPYALKTDIPSLVGYATEDFVNNKLGDYATKDYVTTKLVDYAPLTSVQGFENRIRGLEGAVPQLNERVETVESKVATLNETVSTGENNLLDRVNVIEDTYATYTYVDNAIDGIDLSAYLLKADLTKSRIQSTLGISDWALASAKPSYAWSEITSRPTALSQFTDDVVDGKYLPLSGGTVIGSITASTFIGNLMGNAGSATKLQTPHKLWGNNFDGTADVSGSLYSDIWRIIKDSTWNGTFIQSANYAGTSDLGNIYMSARNGNKLTSFNVWATNSIFSDNIIAPIFKTTEYSSSNPNRKATFSADSLRFYGSDTEGWASGIYISKPNESTENLCVAAAFGASSYTPQFYYYGGRYNDPFLKIYQKDRRIISSGLFMNIGKEISPYASNRAEIALINPNAEPSMLRLGSNGDVKWGIETGGSTDNYAFSIYSWTAATHCLRILNNGNVGIGNTSPTERLDVSGNIKASGNINATSITINGVTITASNGSITVNGNVFATGDITGYV